MSCIVNLHQYDPYIIFNTGYQSENPEIPQEIINNYKIDKYLVKPLWENLRLYLPQYLKEAALKGRTPIRESYKIWVKDVYRQRHYINVANIVCIQQHFENPYHKMLCFSDSTTHIILKISWDEIYRLLRTYHIRFFITNSREHIVVKEHILQYKRPFVYINNVKHKLEIVKNKLAEFEKWMSA